MKVRSLLLTLSLILSIPIVGWSQVYNLPFSGADSSSSCTGVLYDDGGPTGYYSNSSSAQYFIQPPAASNLQIRPIGNPSFGSYDYVRVYDGIGTNGTLILSGSYTNWSSGGSSVTAPSGKATVVFYSNYYSNGQGFRLDWTASSTSTPIANFAVSTSTPAFKAPVQFTDQSSSGRPSVWHFGDGSTSTAPNPTHAYSTSGTHQAYLVSENCSGTDTSASKTITVGAAPSFTVTPDTVDITVPCGNSFSSTVTLKHVSGGSLKYENSVDFRGKNSVLVSEDFELGYGSFGPNSPLVGFNYNLNNQGNGGGKSLRVSGYTTVNRGLQSTFSDASPKKLSFDINADYYAESNVALSYNSNGSYNDLIRVRWRYGRLYFYTNTDYYSSPTLSSNQYHSVSIENIDYTNNTLDVYVNGNLIRQGMTFSWTAGVVNEVNIYSTRSDFTNYDNVELSTVGDVPVKLSPAAGTISNSNSNIIVLNGTTADMNAGTYLYDLRINTNGAGSDSLVIVPVNLTITGTADLQISSNCINFGNLYSSLSATDSVRLTNTGCDTLKVNSSTFTNADFSTGLAAFDLAPDDTLWLDVTFNPGSVATFNDTLLLKTNYGDTTLCLTANSIASPEIATDSTQFNTTVNGCLDSIPVSFTIFNQGGSDLNWTIASGSSFSDDFENGLNTQIWSTQGSNQIRNSCSVNSGSYALSMDGNNRIAETNSINVNPNTLISFWAYAGSGGSSSGCENADGGEDLFLEYSTNGGSTWTRLLTIFNYDTFGQQYTTSIPYTGTVKVRFNQPYHSGQGYDNFIIDDFQMNGGAPADFTPTSATTTAGDSTFVQGKLFVGDLISGNHSFDILINSNDPSDSTYTIPFNLTINGAPQIAVDSACTNFGPLMIGFSETDTIPVYNTGCDSLKLGALSLTSNEYSATVLNSDIVPGDTAWIEVVYTPATIGQRQDTLYVASNDTTAAICLNAEGLGAPSASVNPDSIYYSFNSCNDSITLNLKVRNINGQDSLIYDLSQTDTTKVVLLVEGSYYSSRYGIQTILNNNPKVQYTLSYATTAAGMQADLDGKDMLIIPERSIGYLNSTSAEIRKFASNGGTVVIGLNYYTRLNLLGMIGLGNSTNYANGTVQNMDPSHPIMKDVPNTFPVPSVSWDTRLLSGVNILAKSQSSQPNDAIVAHKSFGRGDVVLTAFNYANPNATVTQILNNVIDWTAGSLPSHLTATPDSGSVAVNDSVNIALKVRSLGLENGRYQSNLLIRTNDPQNPTIEVPFVIDVNGTAEATLLDTACVSFSGVLQGATATDSVAVMNTGCDTLKITSASGSSTLFGVGNLPIEIMPGDTALLNVQFTPVNVGNYSDTLIVSNNDTAFSICVNGSSLGAPVLNVNTDTLEVEVNACKVIKNVPFKLENTGLGTLNYNMKIGGYFNKSKQTYNTTSATTYHTFNGVPQDDTLMISVVVKGDYDDYGERTYLSIDNYSYAYVYDNNLNHQADTIDFLIYGWRVTNWTSDGVLNIDLNNSYQVDGSPGSYHEVIVRTNSNINWASIVGAKTGSLAQSSNTNKQLLFNSTGMANGVYLTNLNISSNAPGSPSVDVPLKMTVVSKPDISISDSCITFPTTNVGDTSTYSFTIYNDGCQPLNISNMAPSNSSFTMSPSSGTIAVSDSMRVTATFIPNNAGNYSATMLVVNNDINKLMCLNAISGSMPVADFQYAITDTCAGTVFFSNESSNFVGNPNWNFGDGSVITQNNPVYSFDKPGTYKVTLTVSNTTGFDTISKYITVNPFFVNFSMTADTVLKGSTVNFYDSSAAATSWTWNFGDGSTSSMQNPSNTFSNRGKYEITLTATDARGCLRIVKKDLYVVDKIGLDDYRMDGMAFSMYPNPASHELNLSSEEIDWSDYRVELYGVNGQLVRSLKPQASTHDLKINVEQLAEGMYQIMILDDSGLKASRKLIIR